MLHYLCGVEKVRIDKWLWAVRLFKTRTLAAGFCERGRVRILDQEVKASRMVKPGDIIVIHLGPFQKHVVVKALSEKRMSASLVKDFMDDITPPEEVERLRIHRLAAASYVVRGQGRPTKKDRRDLDDFMDFEDW
jgi:ribosome-associated heat shock protein Hsp15